MNIYNITAEYMRLLDAIASGEIPEEAIADTLEAVEGDFTYRIDNVSCYIKSLRAEAKAIKDESDILAARAKIKLNEADRLTEFIKNAMTSAGKNKLETPRCKITIKQNPESVTVGADFISWAMVHNEELLSYADPAPDKAKIKSELQAGVEIPGCTLTRGERIEIK
ncbi:MAG: siphovirus Gp157 family protein [Candidatus Omnitrophota bacterium]